MSIVEKYLLKSIKRNEKLKDVIRQYRLFFRQFPWASIVCDAKGIIQDANDTFYNLLQCTKQEIENKSILDYIAFMKDKEDYNIFDMIKKGEIVNIDCNFNIEAGKTKSILATFIPALNNESLIGTYVILLNYPERRKFEDKINLLEENILFGQQLLKTGSWTHDIKKDEIFLTEEVYQILGCTQEEFDGELNHYYDFIHPEDLNKVKEATTEALSGKEYDIEYWIITEDGTEKYIHEKTKALYDENNNPIKMVGTMQDITNRKRIEINLKEIGANLSSAQKIEGIGYWKFDALHNKFFLSDEIYRIFDVNPINFKKDYHVFLELVHPEDRKEIVKAGKGCFKGRAYELVLRIIKSDKTMRYINTKFEPIYGEGQQVVGIIGAIQDITEKKLLEDKLKKSYNNLSNAQSLAHIGSWELNIALDKMDISEEVFRIYGITPDQFDGTYEGFVKHIHKDDIDIFQNLLENPPKENIFDVEFRILRPDGSERNVYQRVEFDKGNDGKPIHASGTIQDITDKKNMETQKLLSKQYFTQDYYDFYEVIDRNGIIKYLSHEREEIFGGIPNKDQLSIFNFLEGQDKALLKGMLKQTIDNKSQKVRKNNSIKTKFGKVIHYEITMFNHLDDPNINGITVYWHDITDRMELEKKITFIATHDELTQLSNRMYFCNQIVLHCQKAKISGARFAIIMLDIDGFKYINDALGYHLADQLILEISKRLKKYVSNDERLCRYSGDQFAIMVSDLNQIKDYDNYAKEILALFLSPFKVENYEINVTVSMGVGIFPEDGQEMETLIKHTNLAMLRSKGQGKNRYHLYTPEMDIHNFKEFELRNDLNKAIVNNQIKVYYQPLVNLETNEIIAAEALVRWEHPTWGLVPPNEFIYIAEETGFIVHIGKWMLKEVCKKYKEWLKKKLPAIKVSVNFSSIQFYEKNFVENIKKTINEYELDPHFFIMEVVESILINDFNKVSSDTNKLREFGIQIALDDFGTGYSSLSYLNRINIDILKIDRSFIKNVLIDETSTIITDHVINMARKLKIKLVAEGIETWNQLQFLRKLNCYAGQGYLYSKPVAPGDFEKLLAKKKCKPSIVNNAKELPFEERRKFFRVNFPLLLEATMSIVEINGKAAKVGNTKVLVKNIGPGGLCFISNIRLPIKKNIILQFSSQLLGKEVTCYGRLVWAEDINENVSEYGIEFTFSENDRVTLTGLLNQYQIRLHNNSGQYEGPFIYDSFNKFFNIEEKET